MEDESIDYVGSNVDEEQEQKKQRMKNEGKCKGGPGLDAEEGQNK